MLPSHGPTLGCYGLVVSGTGLVFRPSPASKSLKRVESHGLVDVALHFWLLRHLRRLKRSLVSKKQKKPWGFTAYVDPENMRKYIYNI